MPILFSIYNNIATPRNLEKRDTLSQSLYSLLSTSTDQASIRAVVWASAKSFCDLQSQVLKEVDLCHLPRTILRMRSIILAFFFSFSFYWGVNGLLYGYTIFKYSFLIWYIQVPSKMKQGDDNDLYCWVVFYCVHSFLIHLSLDMWGEVAPKF